MNSAGNPSAAGFPFLIAGDIDRRRWFPQWSLARSGIWWKTWAHEAFSQTCGLGEKRGSRTGAPSPVQNRGELRRQPRAPPHRKGLRRWPVNSLGVKKANPTPPFQLWLRRRWDHSQIEIRGLNRQPTPTALRGRTLGDLIEKAVMYEGNTGVKNAKARKHHRPRALAH